MKEGAEGSVKGEKGLEMLGLGWHNRETAHPSLEFWGISFLSFPSFHGTRLVLKWSVCFCFLVIPFSPDSTCRHMYNPKQRV